MNRSCYRGSNECKMIKKISTVLPLLLFWVTLSHAQMLSFSTPRSAQILKPGIQLEGKVSMEEEARQALLNLFPALKTNMNSLVLESSSASAYSKHFLFVHTHQGVKVYQSSVKINLANNGAVLSVINNLLLFEGVADQHPASLTSQGSMVPVYVVGSNRAQPMYTRKERDEAGVMQELVVNARGEVVNSRTLDLFARKDTVVQTRVFYPDPLTSAMKTYGDDGGLWVNKNGGDYVELNAQRKPVQVHLEFENDTFYTANKYAVIADLENPVRAPYKNKSNNFDFNRSTSTFREMMCLYHITRYRDYLATIDLPFENMFRINVDVDAYSGQDQSRFSSQLGEPGLFFGTGGVPDAEDADVITHEYTHALAFYIAPNTTSGHQRLAVEEANGDYMACQHSKAISDFHWRQVFNWDGHNVYWDGRNADVPNKFPTDIDSGDYYKTSLIWSSMLNDLSLDMGRDMTTRVLIESIYSYANEITMQQAAEMLVAADSLMFSKMHYGPIKYRLVERGFDISLGVNEQAALAEQVVLLNSAGFAAGNADLKIASNKISGFEIQLMDMQGKTLLNKRTDGVEITLSPEGIPAGMYVLTISSNGMSVQKKVERY